MAELSSLSTANEFGKQISVRYLSLKHYFLNLYGLQLPNVTPPEWSRIVMRSARPPQYYRSPSTNAPSNVQDISNDPANYWRRRYEMLFGPESEHVGMDLATPAN